MNKTQHNLIEFDLQNKLLSRAKTFNLFAPMKNTWAEFTNIEMVGNDKPFQNYAQVQAMLLTRDIKIQSVYLHLMQTSIEIKGIAQLRVLKSLIIQNTGLFPNRQQTILVRNHCEKNVLYDVAHVICGEQPLYIGSYDGIKIDVPAATTLRMSFYPLN